MLNYVFSKKQPLLGGYTLIRNFIKTLIQQRTYKFLAVLVVMATLISSMNIALAADKSSDIFVKLAVEQLAGTSFENSDTAFSYGELSARLEWKFLFFDIDKREYEWSNITAFSGNAGDTPWHRVTRIAPGLQYYGKINEQWGIWTKLTAIAGYEEKISSKAWSYNPQLIGFFTSSPQKTYYGGLGLLYHAVDSFVYPILGVAWNTRSRKGFSLALGFPETMLRYGLNKQLAIKMDFEIDVRIYRLATENSIVPDGYLRIENMTPGFTLEYQPAANLSLNARVRWHFRQTLTFFETQGNQRAVDDINSSWAFGAGLDYRF